MKIVIRTDASVNIGSGHVARCLTLADKLKENAADVTFICREHAGSLCDYIAKQDFPVLKLPAGTFDPSLDGTEPLHHAAWLGVTQEADADASINLLKRLGKADWLIVDHYALDARWETRLRPYTGKIMVIDDIADRLHDCELLLDQNLYQNMDSRYRRLVPENCVQLLGSRYALLKPAFGVVRKRLPARDGKVKRILVFMGGGCR